MASMISTTEHAAAIAKIVSTAGEPDIWAGVTDRLTIASGIVSVRFDSARFDDQFGYCSSADEFMQSREKLLKGYVTQLTRFTYLWSALESVIETLHLPEAPERGKIGRACSFIKTASPDDRGFPGYVDVLSEFKLVLESEPSLEPKVLARFETAPAFVSARGLGLYVVYQVRNRFFHGKIGTPWPDGERSTRSPYAKLVGLGSRLVLLSIQHLLDAAHVRFSSCEDADDCVDFQLRLRVLHLKRQPEAQLSLAD
jgi:hypothetical protein